MNQLSNILQNTKNKFIKENYIIQKSYKKIVNEKIAKVTTDILFKNHILYIYVKDNMWASQLIQYKYKILLESKKLIKGIKDVQIKVSLDNYPEKNVSNTKRIIKKDMSQFITEIKACNHKYHKNFNNLLIKNNQEFLNKCIVCGSTLLAKNKNICSLCINTKDANYALKLHNIFNQTPWIKYEELDNNLKLNIAYDVFMKEKKFKINKIYDMIENEYFLLKKNNQIKNEFLKQKIEELIILKLSINPIDLTEELVKNNIPKKWYKLYIN
jgi:hypothetical protein